MFFSSSFATVTGYISEYEIHNLLSQLLKHAAVSTGLHPFLEAGKLKILNLNRKNYLCYCLTEFEYFNCVQCFLHLVGQKYNVTSLII